MHKPKITSTQGDYETELELLALVKARNVGVDLPILSRAYHEAHTPILKTSWRTCLATAPHLGQSIEQIKSFDTLAFILAGAVEQARHFLFIEQIVVGRLRADGEQLTGDGIGLLSVPTDVAEELFQIETLKNFDASRLGPYLKGDREMAVYYVNSLLDRPASRNLRDRIASLASRSENLEQINSGITQLMNETLESVDRLKQKETTGVVSAFAGNVKVAPSYAGWLMKQYGSMPALHLKETKQPIGRDEAMALLGLKTRRGGSERFAAIQQTVRALLGVSIDAFESDYPPPDRRAAEMDIDEFLAEANGAGVREALRLILDLELKTPKLVLIEEPEVHLHPGLEHAVYSYLREKSRDVQMFVTTHSTNFVDSISFQNIYLVSRDATKKTHSEVVDSGEGLLRIPSELGLRLSTVFMFDRLIFVEGPSDEAVLRELSQRLNIDLAKANVEFVQMGGVRNFAHFAAEGTLDLLSRRRIKMRFVTDRDERDDEEVQRMITRLGDRARLVVLQRRELENYLLDPAAVLKFIHEKREAARLRDQPPLSEDDIRNALEEEAGQLKDEVVRLRLEKHVLKSVHLQKRGATGELADRIRSAVAELEGRLSRIEDARRAILSEVDAVWPEHALALAPGTLILKGTTRRFGLGYNKEAGDSARLARGSQSAVPQDISDLLHEISSNNAN